VTSQAQNTITQAIGTPKGRGVIETAINAGQPLNSTVWKQVAQNAWNYFQIGVGVDSNTGLPSAGLGYPYFTDWDLGVYIQAVIDAQKMNLTSTTDANSRLDKVLTFLQTRDLNDATNYPFWFYQAKDGKDYQAQSDQATVTVDTVDTGRLFVALSNLKAYNPSWTDRINYIVYDRSNYAALIDGIKSDCAVSSSIYTYYVVSGFANFWPDQLINAPNTVLNNLFNAPNVTVSGVLLPKSPTSSEPLLCSLFELNSNDSRLAAFTRQVYLAHEAYYNASEQRQYVAFSEGNGPNGFIYEWVISPLGDSWKITPAADYTKYLDMNPIIYNKVALSFLALYNSTFARNMVVYLEQTLPNPTSGYPEGADNNGGVVSSVGSNTNGLILDAALYAIQNNP